MPSTIADDDGERGTGRTTRQIASAKQGALFVVLNSRMIDYTKLLAFERGRTDLKIVSLETASRHGWERTRGLRGKNAVVLDHACWQQMSRTTRQEFLELQHAYEW